MTARTTHERSRQEELGQFLTAGPTAGFMASLFGPLPPLVRVLDAGAGAGSLAAAFVSPYCEKRDGVRTIEATLYEVDGQILDALAATMRECERRCTAAGIRFSFTIHPTGFIALIQRPLVPGGQLVGITPRSFCNGPYFRPFREDFAADSCCK